MDDQLVDLDELDLQTVGVHLQKKNHLYGHFLGKTEPNGIKINGQRLMFFSVTKKLFYIFL